MTTPSPDVSVLVLDGTALEEAINGLETGGASSVLWEHLTGSGYRPQREAANGARVTQHSRERGYTYLSLPFVTAQGATARSSGMTSWVSPGPLTA